MLVLLSTIITLLRGSSAPKSAEATDADKRMVAGSLKLRALPFSIFRENITGKSDCAHLPTDVIMVSPYLRIWALVQVSDNFLKSSTYFVRSSFSNGTTVVCAVLLSPLKVWVAITCAILL